MKNYFYGLILLFCFSAEAQFKASAFAFSRFPNTLEDILAKSINSPEPVSQTLWRSGRPTVDNYKLFAQQGIKIIINLEDNLLAIQNDSKLARRFGMQFYSFPMNPLFPPNDQSVNQILNLLKFPQGKTLVHCKYGKDRTGLIIGLSRVFIEGWQASSAYQEMLQKGFHTQFYNLDNYYKKKTGMRRFRL
jgi:protein tyrosine/serine phosphatase